MTDRQADQVIRIWMLIRTGYLYQKLQIADLKITFTLDRYVLADTMMEGRTVRQTDKVN